jgi:hypothetical protein
VERDELTEAVREVAKERGVSERTVWRWLAASRSSGEGGLEWFDEGRLCGFCGDPLPDVATARREYCDSTCRQYANRQRLARRGFSSSRHAPRGTGRRAA